MSDIDKKIDNHSTGLTKEDGWQEQAAANLAGWKKALADYQNLQKETEQRFEQLKVFWQTDMITQLLPIFDNYATALEHIPPNEKKSSWAIGLEHILRLWEDFLSNQQVEKISALGQTFNPQWHESIGMASDQSKVDQIVVEEKRAGYRRGEVLIRPAQVIINDISIKK